MSMCQSCQMLVSYKLLCAKCKTKANCNVQEIIGPEPKPRDEWSEPAFDGSSRHDMDCGCVFHGWYKDGNDRPFMIVWDTWGWSITRCASHQILYLESKHQAEIDRKEHEQQRREARAAFMEKYTKMEIAMLATEVKPTPIKAALQSFRKTRNHQYWSDNQVKQKIIMTCEPIRPHRIRKRWYVNKNALDLLDWDILVEKSYPKY